MVVFAKDLWSLVQHQQHIDPRDLTAAIEDQVARHDLDYRSRVLIRDSLKALRHYWGTERVAAWLDSSPRGKEIETVCQGPWDDDRGFPSLMRRVMDVTRPETIRQFLQDLAKSIRRPLRLYIGGSAALILPGLLSRHTEDIDVVDEVPPEIRSEYRLLDELKQIHQLELRHYLPMGWEKRVHSIEPIGDLDIYLVDVYDVFLSKLFSARVKDRQDLKTLAPQLDKERLVQLLKETTQSMLASSELRDRAQHNWYALFGEELPA